VVLVLVLVLPVVLAGTTGISPGTSTSVPRSVGTTIHTPYPIRMSRNHRNEASQPQSAAG
jgi:hypothetical protein